VSANHPKKHQTTRDVGRLGGTAALDEPRQGAAVALEIFTHAVQPFDLRRSDQPLRGESGFTRAIAHQPLHRVVAGTRSGELASCERPHCVEHVVQRTRRHHRGLGSQKKAFVHQTGLARSASSYQPGAPSRPARTAAAASIGNSPGSAPKWRKARCSSGSSRW
jgi:hypothetical protein